MTTPTNPEVKEAAREFTEDAFVNHWQRRVKAEQDNTAPFGQLTRVHDCYKHGFIAGAKWAESRSTKLLDEVLEDFNAEMPHLVISLETARQIIRNRIVKSSKGKNERV